MSIKLVWSTIITTSVLVTAAANENKKVLHLTAQWPTIWGVCISHLSWLVLITLMATNKLPRLPLVNSSFYFITEACVCLKDFRMITKNFFRPKVCFLKPVIAPGATAKVNFISIWGRWHQTIFDQVEMKHFGEARIEPGSSYLGSNCSNHNAMSPLALGNTLWRCLKFSQNNQRSLTSMIFRPSKKFFLRAMQSDCYVAEMG